MSLNPDCRDGKHDPCSGTGWNFELDALTSCSCDCHKVKEMMTSENHPGEYMTPYNEELFDVVEKAVTTVKLPLIMKKSGNPVVIGEATVTKHDEHFELYARITSDEAQDFGNLLTSGVVSAVSIGGAIDRSSAVGTVLNKLN
jgi:hypothetical protein